MVNSELPAEDRLQKSRGMARLRQAETRCDLHMADFRFEAGELPHAPAKALRRLGFFELRRGVLPFGNKSERPNYPLDGRGERRKQQ